MLRVFFSRLDIAYPFVAPPGAPADRVKALREAFVKMIADPEFVAEATKLEYNVTPVSGAQIEEIIKNVYASSPKTVERATELRNAKN